MPGENETKALEDSADFQHHFEAAGMSPEELKQDEGKENAIGTEGTSEQASEEKKPEGEGSEAAKPDSNSGGTDSGKESGQEAQGSSAASPETDDVWLEKLRKGETIRPEVIQRWYNQRNNARLDNAQLTARVTTYESEKKNLEARLKTFEDASAQIGSTDPEMTRDAIKLYRDIVANPVGTVQKLLAEVKALGHNIDGIGSGVDTAAIHKILDDRLGKGEQKQETSVDDEVNQFFAKYPDAQLHETVLANIITSFPTLSLEQAYHQLKTQVNENGYDWSKPLGPQAALRQAANKQQTQEKPKADDPPLINGRASSPAIVEREPVDTFGSSETYDDIIRGAMRETGFTTN